MNDSQWEGLLRRLGDSNADSLSTAIQRSLVESALEQGDSHPVSHLFLSPDSTTTGLTARACSAILRWLEHPGMDARKTWWQEKLDKLGRSDAEDAAATLAEFRALGAMLGTGGSPRGGICPEPILEDKAKKTPDFKTCKEYEVYVEVCCARMNSDERTRQADIDKIDADLIEQGKAAALRALEESQDDIAQIAATAAWKREDGEQQRHEVNISAMRQPSGRPAVLTMSTRIVRPAGKPKAEGDIHTIASRLAGKKAGGQAPDGSACVLWMDLCDADWNVDLMRTRPAMLEWKEFPLATTPGIWHAFYGQKDQTLMMERAAPSLGFGRKHANAQVQRFDGRLRHEQGRCWSAAILQCVDGIAVFESPNPKVWLPFSVLREFIGLRGYSPEASFHRFSEDDQEGLSRRLEDVERQLQFYAG